jgi:hypothetical protein
MNIWLHNILCNLFYPFKTHQGISHQLGRDAVVRFECENSAIDVIINFLWKIFYKPIIDHRTCGFHHRYKSAERRISQISQGFQNGPVLGTFTRLRSCIVPAEITEPPKLAVVKTTSTIIFSSETAEPNYTKPGKDGTWVGPFRICVRQPRLPFKMAAVTKNRNFFNCPLLL